VRRLERKMNQLEMWLDSFREKKHQVTVLKDQAEKIERRLEMGMPEICPLCEQPIRRKR